MTYQFITPIRAHKRWTITEIVAVAALKASGKDNSAIAKEVARTKRAIDSLTSTSTWTKAQRDFKTAFANAQKGAKAVLTGSKRNNKWPSKWTVTPTTAKPTGVRLMPGLTPVITPLAKPLAKPLNHNKPWTSVDDRKLINFFKVGVDVKFMSDNLGRTDSSVLGRLKALGFLSFNKNELAYYTVPKLYHKI